MLCIRVWGPVSIFVPVLVYPVAAGIGWWIARRGFSHDESYPEKRPLLHGWRIDGFFLFLLTLAWFHDPLLRGETLLSSADIVQSYPYVVYYSQSIREGELPFWNPHILCGTPFLADVQTAVFYPPNSLYLLLPPGRGFIWDFLLHDWWLSFGMYLLIRALGQSRSAALLGAMALSFSGFVIPRMFSTHKNLLNTAAWIPWLYLAALALHRRFTSRRLAGFSAVAALQFLAGYPQIAQYSWLTLLAFPLSTWFSAPPSYKRTMRPPAREMVVLGLGIGLALIVCLVQILPAMEFIAQSNRQLGVSSESFSQGGPLLQLLANLVLPHLYGFPRHGTYFGALNYMELSNYLGLGVIILCLWKFGKGRRRKTDWILLFGAVLAFLFALGDHTPLIWILYYAIPGGKFFRGPYRWMFFAVISLCLLAARAWDELWNDPPRIDRRRIVFVGGMILIAMSAAFCLRPGSFVYMKIFDWAKSTLRYAYYDLGRGHAQPYTYHLSRLDEAVRYTCKHGLNQLFIAAAVLALIVLRKKIPHRMAFVLMAMIFAFDLYQAQGAFVAGAPNRLYFPGWSSTTPHAATDPYRFLPLSTTYTYNNSMIDGNENLDGYVTLILKRYLDLYAFLEKTEYPPDINKVIFSNYDSPYLSWLNVGTLLSSQPINSARWSLVRSYPGKTWVQYSYKDYQYLQDATLYEYQARESLPRVWLASSVRFANGLDDVKAKLAVSSNDLRNVVLEAGKDSRKFPQDLDGNGTCAFTQVKRHELEARTSTQKSGILYISVSYYTGWSATEDGKPIPNAPANIACIAVPFSSGNHVIRLSYRCRPYEIGLFASASAALLISFLGGYAKRRKGSIF